MISNKRIRKGVGIMRTEQEIAEDYEYALWQDSIEYFELTRGR